MADGVTPVVSPDQNSGKKTNPTNDLDSQSLCITTGILTDLKEDIRRLKAELEMKDALLSKFMDVSFAQSKRLTSLSAALQDTAPWDPSTCAHPSSSSTPRQRSLDEEVVVRRSRMRSDETRKPPVLSLSNRFSGLAADSPAPSAAVTAAQTPPDLGSTMDFPALRRDATEIPKEDGRIAACSNPDRGSRITAKAPSGSDERLDLPASSRAPASSSRRRILKEAEGSCPLPFQQGSGLAAADGPPAASCSCLLLSRDTRGCVSENERGGVVWALTARWNGAHGALPVAQHQDHRCL
ncbi:uncharacterized protein LOC144986887 [Oryzias latipes]